MSTLIDEVSNKYEGNVVVLDKRLYGLVCLDLLVQLKLTNRQSVVVVTTEMVEVHNSNVYTIDFYFPKSERMFTIKVCDEELLDKRICVTLSSSAKGSITYTGVEQELCSKSVCVNYEVTDDQKVLGVMGEINGCDGRSSEGAWSELNKFGKWEEIPITVGDSCVLFYVSDIGRIVLTDSRLDIPVNEDGKAIGYMLRHNVVYFVVEYGDSDDLYTKSFAISRTNLSLDERVEVFSKRLL